MKRINIEVENDLAMQLKKYVAEHNTTVSALTRVLYRNLVQPALKQEDEFSITNNTRKLATSQATVTSKQKLTEQQHSSYTTAELRDFEKEFFNECFSECELTSPKGIITIDHLKDVMCEMPHMHEARATMIIKRMRAENVVTEIEPGTLHKSSEIAQLHLDTEAISETAI
jgi:hypothetical protein